MHFICKKWLLILAYSLYNWCLLKRFDSEIFILRITNSINSLFQFSFYSKFFKLLQSCLLNHKIQITKCFISSQKGKLIPLGKLKAGLYNVPDKQVSLPDTSHSCNKVCLAAVEDAKLWHLRLGHLPFSKLQLLNISCDVKSCLYDTICQICPKAKQTRVSFPRSSIKTTHPFELIHIDVWGPHFVSTPTRCTQFLTIVDDFSR